MSTVEYRYLPGGRVRHILPYAASAEAICGLYTTPASDWRGTGSQREYEHVETLRTCRRCSGVLRRTTGVKV